MIEFRIKNGKLVNCTTDESIVTIPDEVTYIYRNAFSNQLAIEEIVLNDNIYDLDVACFCGMEKLKKVKLSKKLKSLPYRTFENCFDLEEINLEYIEHFYFPCFINCYKLKSVALSSKLKTIAPNTFINCLGLESINVDNNQYFKSIDGVLYNSDLSELIIYPSSKVSKTFVFNDNLEKINKNLFEGNRIIECVKFNDKITEVPDSMFTNCIKLKEVKFNDKIKRIGVNAFTSCKSLEAINFSNDLRTIGAKAFNGCTGLVNIEFGNNLHLIDNEAFKDCINLKSLIFKDGLSTIGGQALKGCKGLEKLYIPKSVVKIGEEFISETNNVLYIIYGGNSKKWIELTKPREVITSHPSQNDYHYYGDWTDKVIPTVYETVQIIPSNVKYKVYCEKDNMTLDYSK